VSDWREKLSGLGKDLRHQEQSTQQAEQQAKATLLTAFRKRLTELEPLLRAASEFGDAFGVDCEYEVSRFEHRHPFLRFRILRPPLLYEVECRDGAVQERIREGTARVQETQTTLEHLTPGRFEKRLTDWVQAAAQANRKMPGRG
jgi:hypothetical protein